MESEPKDDVFLFAREHKEVIEIEISLYGYFVIVTLQKMSARKALELFKSQDTSEKLFRGNKSYLGNKSLRVQSDEAASAKIFVELIALKELEKIEVVRQLDGKYRLNHAVTASQKTISGAFWMSSNYIKDKANVLSRIISKSDIG